MVLILSIPGTRSRASWSTSYASSTSAQVRRRSVLQHSCRSHLETVLSREKIDVSPRSPPLEVIVHLKMLMKCVKCVKGHLPVTTVDQMTFSNLLLYELLLYGDEIKWQNLIENSWSASRGWKVFVEVAVDGYRRVGGSINVSGIIRLLAWIWVSSYWD